MATILVVDDEPSMRAMVRLVLESEGYDVVEANDGAQALARVENAEPDLVLLDLMMPGMDGWHFLDELHARGLRNSVRIVIVSALSDSETLARGRSHGARGHLVKPFDLVALVDIVEAALADPPERLLAKSGRMEDLTTLLRELDKPE